MFEKISLKSWWVLFLIALALDIIENIVLLYFFEVSINKNTLIGSSIFALAIVAIYKLIEKNA